MRGRSKTRTLECLRGVNTSYFGPHASSVFKGLASAIDDKTVMTKYEADMLASYIKDKFPNHEMTDVVDDALDIIRSTP